MHCWGPETLLVCSAEQAWEERSCPELCAAMVPSRLSAGCYHSYEDACRCTLEGTACADQPPRCDDEETLLRCAAGRWVVEYCDQRCPSGGWSTCSAWGSEEGAGCACSAA